MTRRNNTRNLFRARACPMLAAIAAFAACRSEREPRQAATLDAPVPIAVPIDPPAAAGALAPNLHATEAGVLATWLEPVDPAGSHRLRCSRWQDGRWSEAVTITEGGGIVANWADVPSAAAATADTLVAHWAEKSGAGVRAIWLDGRAAATGGPTALRSALVTDQIRDEEVIDPRVCDCCGTAAVTTPDGPVVVYRDRSEDELRDIAAASRASDSG